MHPKQPQSQQQQQQPPAPASQMQSHIQQHPHPTQTQSQQQPQLQGQPALPPPPAQQQQQQQHHQQSLPPVSQQQQQHQHPSHSHQPQSHYPHHTGHHLNHNFGHHNQQMLHSQNRPQQPQQQHIQHQHHQQTLPHHQQQHQSHHNHHHNHHPQQHQHQQHPQQQQHHNQHHHTPGQHNMQMQPNQHMMSHVPPQMISYQPQGMMYAPHPMAHHPHLFPAGSHVTHQFNPAVPPPPQPQQTTTNHRPDQVNVGSQPPQQGQQPHQPQQPQPPQPGSINPNNLPPQPTHGGPMHPPAINTSTAANTGVHQMNNGSILDSHMQHRIPISQAPMIPQYSMQYAPYNMPAHMLHYNLPPHPYQNAHLPPATSAPFRLPVDMTGIRPTYDTHNHATPVAAKVPSSQAAPIVGVKPPGPISHVGIAVPPLTAPKQPLPQRERKKLAIVDPKTKHVFTDEELKGSLAKTSSPTTTTSTTIASTTSTTIAATTIASTAPPPVDIAASKDESPSTTITSEQKKPPSSIEATLQTTPSVPSSVPEMTSTSNVSPQHSDRTTSSSTPTTISPKSPIVSVAATSVPTVHELSTTTNAIRTSPSTLVEGMHALSVTDLKPTIQMSATISNVESEIRHLGGYLPPRDAVDHALALGGEPITGEKNDDKVVQDAADEDKQPETPNKQLNPAFPYEPDQYSPMNPSGRKKYTIKFLHAIGNFMFPPDPTNTDFLPSYMQQRSGPNQRYGDGYGMPRRNSQQALNNKQQQQAPRRIIQTQSLQPEVELKTVEKPWKPELDVEKSKAIETGEIDTQRLLKLFRGHLNKITPQKYDDIMAKVNDLDLDSDEKLKSVIDLVFDKAVDEPGFCEIYARMSKKIATKYQRFFYHLVKKCQDEFETTDLYEGLNVVNRELDIEKESDPAKKKLLKEELYEDMRLRRKKYLGTVKLIGEMYKLGLLIPKIIGMCMMRLIEEASNENIECLCSLITTVGAKMASEQEDEIKSAFKHTLSVLSDIAHSKKAEKLFTLEQRVKFKILDTIDLSRKNWKPRMEQNNPMKLEEVREEAKRESAMKQHNHAKNHPKNDDRNRRPNNSSSNSFSRTRY